MAYRTSRSSSSTSTEHPPLAPSSRRDASHRLRAQLPFFGRAAELAHLEALFRDGARVVTVLGAGGMGKTRLAARYADLASVRGDHEEVCACSLVECRSIDAACAAIADALNAPARTADAIDAIGATLAELGNTLLVLDNCEQIAGSLARAITMWREIAPRIAFLLTSRERLRLVDEYVLELPPLALPRSFDGAMEAESVQLLLDGARRIGREIDPNDLPAVVSIVRRLEGVPLAIELASARLAVVSPSALLERLSRGLDVLSSNRRDVSPRHSTLRDTLAWSWDLLSAEERIALAHCAVFRGGFSLEDAEAVIALPAASTATVIDLVQSLRDRSLLRTFADARLSFFESIREYAVEKLVASGGEREPARRHADHFLARAEHLRDDVPRISVDRDNLLAVHDRALAGVLDATYGLRAALVLQPVFHRVGPLGAAISLLDRAIERAVDAPADLVARALVARAHARSLAGDRDHARRDLERAIALTRAAFPTLEAEAHSLLAGVFLELERDRSDAAEHHAGRALALIEAGSDRTAVAVARSNLAEVLLHDEQYERAQTLLEQALALHRETGDRRREARGAAHLAGLLIRRGDFVGALRQYEAACTLASELGDRSHWAFWTLGLAFVLRALGRREESGARFLDAIALLRAFGSDVAARATPSLHEIGEHVDAYRRFTQAFVMLRGRLDAVALAAVGAALANLDDVERAEAFQADAVRAADGTDDTAFDAVAVLGGHLALARARAEGREESARASVADLVARFDDDRRPDVANAVQGLRHALGLTRSPVVRRSLVVDAEARWFQVDDETRVDLARRRSLRHVLLTLVRHRIDAPGDALSVGDLVARAWPGEKMLAASGASRVHMAIMTLRKIGLRTILISHTSGYAIDRHADVTLQK